LHGEDLQTSVGKERYQGKRDSIDLEGHSG